MSVSASVSISLVTLIVLALASEGFSWSSGHEWIRHWAVNRLPPWQVEHLGEAELSALWRNYTSLQDLHAGGRRPDLDAYCRPADLSLSLHDVNANIEATYLGVHWYLQRVAEQVRADRRDEAMKYLGVLCHWMEDPGSPSMHSSPVDEMTLRELLPPPAEKQGYNYLYGAGWIDLEGNDYAKQGRAMISDLPYEPRLLGSSLEEAAARIANEQREVRLRAGGRIIPLIQARISGDEEAFVARVGEALLDSAKLTADVIHTAAQLSSDRDRESGPVGPQRLTTWTPLRPAGLAPHPYYAVHYLLNQSMDAARELHPLRFAGPEQTAGVTHGFGSGAPVAIRFSIATGGVYRKLRVRVGLHPSAGKKGAARFSVLIDGQEAAATEIMRSGEGPIVLTVDLPKKNVLDLTLQTIAGDGSESEHNLVVWGDPELLP